MKSTNFSKECPPKMCHQVPPAALFHACQAGSTGWWHHPSPRPGEVKPLSSTEVKLAADKLSNSSRDVKNICPRPSPKKKNPTNIKIVAVLVSSVPPLQGFTACCARERLLRAPGEMLKVLPAPGRDKKAALRQKCGLELALMRFGTLVLVPSFL